MAKRKKASEASPHGGPRTATGGKKMGRPKGTPRVNLTVRVDHDLHELLSDKELVPNRSQFVEEAIKHYREFKKIKKEKR